MSGIFGGSKQKQSSTQQSSSTSHSESGNQAYPWLQQQYGGQVGTGLGANNAIANLLGLGDSQAGADAFNAYKNSAGYQSALTAGTDAIMGNKAAGGLLQSGSALRGISRFGSDLASQYYDKYLNNLLGLSNQGLQAGSLISGAGQYSKSDSSSQSTGSSTGSSSSKPGIGGLIGGIASAIPSDQRLKTDIVQVGELENGLPVYEYRYNWEPEGTVRTGVMAQEVELIAPEALGPELNGFKTVRYDLLLEVK